MIQLGLIGSSGRMGKQVAAVCALPEFRSRVSIVVLFQRGMKWDQLEHCDAVIDFSSPDAALEALRAFVDFKKKPAFISGTTGWSESQKKELENYGMKHPCLVASNFSSGVLALSHLVEQARGLPELEGYQIHIRETHHSHKKDRPSGTALSLQKLFTKKPDIDSIREGEVVGTHEVIFESPAEKISLIHEAKDRSIFARGAVEAAVRLTEGRNFYPSKLLSLHDVFSS